MTRKHKKEKKQAIQSAKKEVQTRYNSISLALSKSLLGGLISGAVSVIALYEALNYFRNDPQTFYFIIFPIIAVIASVGLLIQAFRQKSPIAYAWLSLGMLIITGALIGWQSYIETTKSKLVIVIATFDGPEEVYGLRNEIFESLNLNFRGDDEVKIIGIDEIVTPIDGSAKARKIREQNLADFVIWGWYRPIEYPNINIHIENLSSEQQFPLEESTVLQPVTTLAELETSTFQQLAGKETSALISFLHGYALGKSGDHDAAIVRFDEALQYLQGEVQILENLSEIYLYRGMSHFHLKHFEDAIENWNEVIEINPEDPSAYINRGFANFMLHHFDLALQDINKGVELDPKDANSYRSRADFYLIQNQYDKAITDYDFAVRLSSDLAKDVAIYNNRGVSYYNLDNCQKAITDFNMAIQLMPDEAASYHNRAVCYDTLGQYDEALRDFNYAIHLIPTEWKTYVWRGDTYYHQGKIDKAIKDYTRAIQLEPDDPYAYNHRAFVYASQGQYEKAIIDRTHEIQLAPNEPRAYLSRGSYYEELGKVAEAEADFKKYEELTGQKP